MGVPHHGGFMLPLHRRRPLKSKTYDTLLSVLSLSSHPSFSSPLQGDDGSQKVQELCPTESHKTLVDSDSVLHALQEGESFLNMQSSLDLITCKKDKEQNQGLDDAVDLVVDEGTGSDLFLESIDKCNSAHCMLGVQSSSFSPGRELKGNEEFSVKEVCEAIDCSLHVDASDELLLRHGESGEQVSAVEEQNMSVETAQELQRREMELEKLIMSSDFVDASHPACSYEDIEEGELPRGMGIDDISVDILSRYDILPTADKANKLQPFKYSSDGEKFALDVRQSEIEKHKEHTSSLDAITRENDIMDVDGKPSGEKQIYKSGSDEINIFETQQADGHGSFLVEISGGEEQSIEMNLLVHSAVASDCQAPAGDIKSKSVEENKRSAATEKDDDAPKNKKKRGPLTKERRAKKKKKERIKRSEKNRMLGVKRLKIQPMVKPKAVSYCRHYLRGRCQEGEKCKFSHDTVPLTKSMPCCHFARHSCMKGDDCPFDHQLSKYPCNNYASKGFCSRGLDCLFSHEIPAKEARPVISYVSAYEMKTPSASGHPNPKNPEKQEHINGTSSQQVEAKSCPTGLSNVRNNEQQSAVPVKIPSIQPPKGVNILVHGHMSAVMGKQLDSQLPKTDSGDKGVQSLSHNHQKVNDVVDMAAARTPKGINFLSFGKSPMSGSNSKVVSILPPHRDARNGKSALVTPTPNGDSQCREIASAPQVPHGINFISNRKSSNNCISNGQLNHHPSEDKSALTSVREGEYASERSQMPCPASSSFMYKSAIDREVGIASSSKSSFLSETSPLEHKALHSTLSFAANVEPLMKLNSSKTTSFLNKSSGSSQDQANAPTVLDFLYGSDSKPKT